MPFSDEASHMHGYISKGYFSLLLMCFMVLAPLASRADSDGDGVDDSVDDCPWASGLLRLTETVCPDKDGDGTSDIVDKWTTSNPNFQNEYTTTSSGQDYTDVDYSSDGKLVVSSSENGFIRIWNATSYVNTRSVSTSGVEVTSVSFSPDGQYVLQVLMTIQCRFTIQAI